MRGLDRNLNECEAHLSHLIVHYKGLQPSFWYHPCYVCYFSNYGLKSTANVNTFHGIFILLLQERCQKKYFSFCTPWLNWGLNYRLVSNMTTQQLLDYGDLQVVNLFILLKKIYFYPFLIGDFGIHFVNFLASLLYSIKKI